MRRSFSNQRCLESMGASWPITDDLLVCWRYGGLDMPITKFLHAMVKYAITPILVIGVIQGAFWPSLRGLGHVLIDAIAHKYMQMITRPLSSLHVDIVIHTRILEGVWVFGSNG